MIRKGIKGIQRESTRSRIEEEPVSLGEEHRRRSPLSTRRGGEKKKIVVPTFFLADAICELEKKIKNPQNQNPNPRSRNAGRRTYLWSYPAGATTATVREKEPRIAVVRLEHSSCRSTSRRLRGRLGPRAPSQGLSTAVRSPSGERTRRRRAPRRCRHPPSTAMVTPWILLLRG
jgi:hypothetical protein